MNVGRREPRGHFDLAHLPRLDVDEADDTEYARIPIELRRHVHHEHIVTEGTQNLEPGLESRFRSRVPFRRATARAAGATGAGGPESRNPR